ncbi:hypothetical protein [Ruegeria arenilitoris]|uniref:hypothetical protein n=1 Tax=Ruegeria arenilitoris TaxID=1173585 RepID=UPI00147A15EA|nr:hypothetical protein [Ruegeria arenilitoris]
MSESRLLESSPYEVDEGQLIGRDPREISSDAWDGIPYLIGMKAIRAKCLDCCNDSAAEVRKCVCTTCPLWPLRMGSVPKDFRIHGKQQNPHHETSAAAIRSPMGETTGDEKLGLKSSSGGYDE